MRENRARTIGTKATQNHAQRGHAITKEDELTQAMRIPGVAAAALASLASVAAKKDERAFPKETFVER